LAHGRRTKKKIIFYLHGRNHCYFLKGLRSFFKIFVLQIKFTLTKARPMRESLIFELNNIYFSHTNLG
jgi:hypothetical protein